jgi:hypothetical protein
VKIILKNNKEIKQNSRSQPALHEMLRKFYRLKRSKIDLMKNTGNSKYVGKYNFLISLNI